MKSCLGCFGRWQDEKHDAQTIFRGFILLGSCEICMHIDKQSFPLCICVLVQRYLDEAEREKMQYAQELKEYQQTEAYQITSAKIQDKKMRKGDMYI